MERDNFMKKAWEFICSECGSRVDFDNLGGYKKNGGHVCIGGWAEQRI